MQADNHTTQGQQSNRDESQRLEAAVKQIRDDPTEGSDNRFACALNYGQKGIMRCLLDEFETSRQWIEIHNNRDLYFQYLQKCCTTLSAGLLLSLAEIAMLKDTTEATYRMEREETYFRWIEIMKGKTLWRMEVRDFCSNEWHPWIELCKSPFGASKICVRSLKTFHEGCPLGFYLGQTVWRDSKCHARIPSSKFLDLQHPSVEDFGRQVLWRDNQYRMCLVKPNVTRFCHVAEPQAASYYMHMGFHYMNDHLEDHTAGLAPKLYYERNTNVILLEDGLLVASRCICKGDILNFVLD